MGKPRDAASGDASAPSGDTLPELLRGWVIEQCGGRAPHVRRLPGGNRREAWLIEVADDRGTTTGLFLRYDPSPASSVDDPYTLWREAAIVAAISRELTVVPGVVAVHPSVQAVLLEFAHGDVNPRIAGDDQDHILVAQDFMRHLAALHMLNPSVYEDVMPRTGVATMSECITDELDIWESMYRRSGIEDPLAEFAFRWLRKSLPEIDERPVLLHGDAGPGNFLCADGKVTAILDWELAHLGDPMEDLAWLSVRTAQEGFPDFATRVREYEELTGREVSEERMRYFRVFVELRIVTIRLRAAASNANNGEVGNSILSQGLHRRLCTEALAEAMGMRAVISGGSELLVQPDALEWVSRDALRELHEIVQRSDDSMVIKNAKGVARAIKLLAGERRLSVSAERAERDELSRLLRADVHVLTHGRAALARRIREEELGDEAVMEYLMRVSGWDGSVLESVMGSLAQRHLPAIR